MDTTKKTKPRFSRFDCHPGCSVEATVSLIDAKWKGIILFMLLGGPVRFNQVRRRLPNVTQRILTNQLREMEADGLIDRKIHTQVPPKVEYSLTPLGRSLETVINAMKSWGDAHIGLFKAGDSAAPPPEDAQTATSVRKTRSSVKRKLQEGQS